MPIGYKVLTGLVSGLGAGGAALIYSMEQKVRASGGAHWPSYPWNHKGALDSLDHAAVRRGFEVYQNVCKACHGLKFMTYRRLIDFTHSKEELKAEIADIMIEDGPDRNGKMFERPAKVTDFAPDPYPNKEAAIAANNGANPPDLSLMPIARNGGEDYLFSLLTGYMDAPAGMQLNEGQYFNPYFAGGIIGMPPPLYNGVMEYSDGTPATVSQMAKDVVTFLTWTADPNFDERKSYVPKILPVLAALTLYMYYLKRVKWAPLWTMKARFVPPKPKGRKK